MRRYITLFIALSGLILSACKTDTNNMENPFFLSYDTPHQVPPFSRIQAQHFLPALDSGIAVHNREIEAILTQENDPTFENTIEALDLSGELMGKVSYVFNGLNSAHGTDEIQAISGDFRARQAQHSDEVGMNTELFRRIEFIYQRKDSLNLNQEQAYLLEKYYNDFIRKGVSLPEEQKERLKAINLRLSELRTAFEQNLLAETNNYALVIEDKEQLTGLPDDVISGAAARAEKMEMQGKWVFTTHKPSMIPFLQFSENRELRQEIYDAYCMRGNNDNEQDNKAIIAEMAILRIEKAHLLGFPSYAAYQLDNKMAKTPDAVYELLDKVWEKALPVARQEREEMQAIIDTDGGDFKLAASDWWFYAEKLRKEKYDLDESEIRPYLELNQVINGVFTVSSRLFGISFHKIEADFPKPHPEAEVFEVFDADSSFLGILYMDYFTRPTKAQGAWCGRYRSQYKTDNEDIRPVVTIVTNFANPVNDGPVLLSLDQTETLFHEFGHALHNLLSDVAYQGISCTRVKRDFVELPSQIMENWATHEKVLEMYAKHYQTGEVMPDELINKLQRAATFNQGFATVEYVAASYLDMNFHTLDEKQDLDIEKFEEDYLNGIGLIPEIISRYRSTYFKHIWSSGYSAGYYSYMWAEVLEKDAFEAFLENGIFDAETAAGFRSNILEKGGGGDPMEMYIRFRGREPQVEPLLKGRGLL